MSGGAAIAGYRSATTAVDGVSSALLGGWRSWRTAGALVARVPRHQLYVAQSDSGPRRRRPGRVGPRHSRLRRLGQADRHCGCAGRALAQEFRSLVRQTGVGAGRPITLVAPDMGAPLLCSGMPTTPKRFARVMYVEVPFMLVDVLTKIIAYKPERWNRARMWWWIQPLDPDVPQRLIVGNERVFLTWFYDRNTDDADAIEPATSHKYLRTFSRQDGVLGALGVYRAAFTTIAQTTPLTSNKVHLPIVAIGSQHAQGTEVAAMVELVADNIEGAVIADCGHFVPEEQPDEIIHHMLAMIRGEAVTY